MGYSPFLSVDHVQLAMPVGGEVRARAFYGEVLGMAEIAKPENLQSRGGTWFSSDKVQLHLGVEADFRPARRAHPAFRCVDYALLLEKLRKAGVSVASETEPFIDGSEHAYIDDPFGNRIEIIASPKLD